MEKCVKTVRRERKEKVIQGRIKENKKRKWVIKWSGLKK